MLLAVPAQAMGWGYFTGSNAKKEKITLEILGNLSNDNPENTYDDRLPSTVRVKARRAEMSFEDMCHRRAYRESIWCNGNPRSPLYGTTFRFVREIRNTATEELPNRELWKCVAGCNRNAPGWLRYTP